MKRENIPIVISMTYFLIIKALFSNLEDYGEIINKQDICIWHSNQTKENRKPSGKYFPASLLRLQIKLHITDEKSIWKHFSCSLRSVCQMIMSVRGGLLKKQKMKSHADSESEWEFELRAAENWQWMQFVWIYDFHFDFCELKYIASCSLHKQLWITSPRQYFLRFAGKNS